MLFNKLKLSVIETKTTNKNLSFVNMGAGVTAYIPAIIGEHTIGIDIIDPEDFDETLEFDGNEVAYINTIPNNQEAINQVIASIQGELNTILGWITKDHHLGDDEYYDYLPDFEEQALIFAAATNNWDLITGYFSAFAKAALDAGYEDDPTDKVLLNMLEYDPKNEAWYLNRFNQGHQECELFLTNN